MNQDDTFQDSSSAGGNGTNGAEVVKLIVPFEDPSKDFFTGLFQTMKLVLFQPTNFFRNYKLDGSIGKPLLFAMIVGWVSAAISMIWGMFISEWIFTALRELRDHLPEIEGMDWEQWEQIGAAEGAFDTIVGIILAPFFILIAVFIAAGIYHLFLLMVKGANKNFETTFNVTAYGMAAQVAQIIPFCGSLIAWAYGIVLAIIGLTEAHKTDSWKAVFAVFGPGILCCFCCLLIIMLLGGIGALVPALEKIPWN
ncbi:MAG: YIP1 family protein [Candidatus Aminicenantes bacterium]|nr:MAG: YIP1 family protein [Candidatus Aminicenantes bacterium]